MNFYINYIIKSLKCHRAYFVYYEVCIFLFPRVIDKKSYFGKMVMFYKNVYSETHKYSSNGTILNLNDLTHAKNSSYFLGSSWPSI
jgi:hypothetical protein